MGLLTSLTGGASDAQVATAIAAAQGLGQQLVLSSFDTTIGVTPAALTANRAHLAYIGRLARPLTLASLSCYVGSPLGNLDLALLSRSGTTVTRLASTGSQPVAGTSAILTLVPTTTPIIAAGIDLYVSLAPDNATATFGRISGSSPILAMGTRVAFADTQFPTGSSFTITTPTSVMPLLFATFTG